VKKNTHCETTITTSVFNLKFSNSISIFNDINEQMYKGRKNTDSSDEELLES